MTKIKAVFVKKIGNNIEEIKKPLKIKDEKIKEKLNTSDYEEIHDKKLKETETSISYEGKTFIIPQTVFSIKRKKDIEIYFDWENEKMLFFKEQSVIFDAKFLDKLLHNEIIAQLMKTLRKSMEKTDKFSLLGKLVIPVLCLAVGYFAGKII